jgi:hypothetical protein
MPALSTDVSLYIKRVVDTLRTGPNYSAAELLLGSGTSAIKFVAANPGVAGNSIRVAVSVPAGTSALAVSVSGNDVTIALDVTLGVPNAGANTATLVTAAVNAAAADLMVAFLPVGSGAGSLSAAVALTSLSGGRGGEGGVNTLPLNFLRAQDMASVLDLFQDAVSQPAPAAATGGTTTSVQNTGSFVASSQIGNTVVFTGNVTAALAGVQAVVVSNTANAMFFALGALPVAPAAGDTYTIVGSFAAKAIADLRDGRGPGDAPAGNLYGDSRVVADILARCAQQLGGALAPNPVLWSGLTAAGSFQDDRVCTVKLNLTGGALRIDQFKNMLLNVAGQAARKIVSSNESNVVVAPPYSAAPAGGLAASVVFPEYSTDASRNYTFAPGGQTHDNRALAELILAAEAAVVAFTLPV